jgi:chromosome segregation ATPase
MIRALHYTNLFGVLALSVVCILQWRINRDLNLQAGRLEKERINQQIRLEEQDKQIKAHAADLDSFREHVQKASLELKAAESNLIVARQHSAQLTAERDQLNESIEQWTRAVAQRDEQLTRASEQLQKLATERNEIVTKFNGLASKHNEVVEQLNHRTREYNTLAERVNNLAKSGARSSE